MRRSKYYIVAAVFYLIYFCVPLLCANKGEELSIVLDPGHGGSQSGAVAVDGITEEKEINLKIAKFLQKELEKYEGVQVYLTRDGDYDVDLSRRSEIAEELNADLLVSLHNNAYDGKSGYDHGAFVLTSKGNYRKKTAFEEQRLACNILYELSDTGLYAQGLLLRDSESNQKYPNGKPADYYRIIKDGIMNDRRQILIEHAYVDNENDFLHYLNSDHALHILAQADARGIARYFGLKEKSDGTVLHPPGRYEVKLITFLKGFQTRVETRVIYQSETVPFPYYRKYFEFFDHNFYNRNPLLKDNYLQDTAYRGRENGRKSIACITGRSFAA